MITFRNQNTSATPKGIQLLHLAHHPAERTSYAKDVSQATEASPRQLWFLAVAFTKRVEEGPQNSGRLQGHDVHIYQWMTPGGHHMGCSEQAKRCNDSLHLRLTFVWIA